MKTAKYFLKNTVVKGKATAAYQKKKSLAADHALSERCPNTGLFLVPLLSVNGDSSPNMGK